MNLTRIVFEIVQSNPNGLRHSDIVKEVLESGYNHSGEIPLSRIVHDTLQELVFSSIIGRSEEEKIRRYHSYCLTSEHHSEESEKFLTM